METPFYLSFLSKTITVIYLYLFVPISIILESYILIAYCLNMMRQENILAQNKFRRGVAIFFPFLLSLYSVLISENHKVLASINLQFYYLLFLGLLVGLFFMYWISSISKKDGVELFATLSCFVASLIFFTVLTVFIVTRSFEIISFVFGFLFGVCGFVIRYGFDDISAFKLFKKFNLFKKIHDWKERRREKKHYDKIDKKVISTIEKVKEDL